MAYQFHMTTEMASYHMIHELISDDMNPVFEYGKAAPYRLLQNCLPERSVIPVANLPEYRVVSEPSTAKIYYLCLNNVLCQLPKNQKDRRQGQVTFQRAA